MLKEVFYFLKGYVIIRVCGKFPERVLNIATAKDILCWDVKSIKGGIAFKVSAKAYPFMKEICEKCSCTMSTGAKIGMMFSLKRHKKRHALLWGVGLFFAIVVFSLSFLWEIEIGGNEKIPENEIIALLSESGISRGKFLYFMDPEKACNDIYNKDDRLAWIGIEIRGTKALVSVAEKRPKPYVRDETVPCNIVADKDGMVYTLHVRIGEPCVNEGDAVLEGQLIVSGILDSAVLGYRTVHADADIIFKTWHEKTVEQPLYEIKRNLSGRYKNRYFLNLSGHKVPLQFGKIPYEIYDTEYEYKGFIIKEKISEVFETKTVFTDEQAIGIAKAAYEKELSEKGELVNITYTYENNNGEENSLIIHFTAELLESAGRKQEIARDTNGENPAG